VSKTSFPEWLVPMAATLTQERFTGPEWLFERKFDGIRLLAYKNGLGLPRARAHWVRPEIVVQVGFIEWTVHGKLRHPRLLGVRTDKGNPPITQIQVRRTCKTQTQL
jgi:ATP-dependent DNA ligase